jgi:hypothetical protein
MAAFFFVDPIGMRFLDVAKNAHDLAIVAEPFTSGQLKIWADESAIYRIRQRDRNGPADFESQKNSRAY